MPEPQYYLEAAEGDGLRQVFTLDQETTNDLHMIQDTINSLGNPGYSHAVIVRLAIQVAAAKVRLVSRENNPAALDQLRRMAWDNSSKQSQQAPKAAPGETPGNRHRDTTNNRSQ